MERARHVHQRVFENPLDAGGAVGKPPAVPGLEVDRIVHVARRSEHIDEPRRVRSRGRRVVLEVIEVESERAIRRAADHLADFVDHARTPVRREPHHLVLVLVHGEAEIRRERRIQHAQRMREPDFAQCGDVGASVSAVRMPLPVADGERGPLADAVGGQDRGAIGRRRQERGGRVRLVVPGEEHLRPRYAEVRRDRAAHPDLVAERALHRLRKRSPRTGKGAQRAGENPLELQHAAFVKHHRVEIRRIEAGVIEAPLDRREGKGGVVLPPRQALFLHGADRHAVDNERRRRIVVVR